MVLLQMRQISDSHNRAMVELLASAAAVSSSSSSTNLPRCLGERMLCPPVHENVFNHRGANKASLTRHAHGLFFSVYLPGCFLLQIITSGLAHQSKPAPLDTKRVKHHERFSTRARPVQSGSLVLAPLGAS